MGTFGLKQREIRKGDWVRATKTCSGAKKGEMYQVTLDRDGDVIIAEDISTCDGCSCDSSWELICGSKHPTPFKVGDRVRSRQPDHEYTGVISRIGKETASVKSERYGEWGCKIVDGRIATADGVWDGESYLEKIEEEILYPSSEFIKIKNKKTFMSNIVEFAKNLVLSADEKLLRKVGLKDSCGEYSRDAKEIIITKLCKENEAHLLEVAKAMDEENKANKD